jgi:hypothetical protein
MGWLHGGWMSLGMILAVRIMTSAQETPCEEFYRALEDVPHLTLALVSDSIQPIWSSEPAPACEVTSETTDSILAGAVSPDFLAEAGSTTYEAGWRLIPEILADGAGSGVHGIERNGTGCVVLWEQPAYLDDDGTFVQSDTFSLLIQCSGAGGPDVSPGAATGRLNP